MAWTEEQKEQKEQGRVDLQRRKANNTPATLRRSFSVAVAGCGASLLLLFLAVSSLRVTSDWPNRLVGISTAVIALIALAFTAVLAYVRYLDWRRGPVTP